MPNLRSTNESFFLFPIYLFIILNSKFVCMCVSVWWRRCIIQNTFNNSLPTEWTLSELSLNNSARVRGQLPNSSNSYARYGLRTTDVFPSSLLSRQEIRLLFTGYARRLQFRLTKVFLGADHWTSEWGGGMGDFRIKMISCRLQVISTKKIIGLKKQQQQQEWRIMLKKPNQTKQNNNRKVVIQKILSSEVWRGGEEPIKIS